MRGLRVKLDGTGQDELGQLDELDELKQNVKKSEKKYRFLYLFCLPVFIHLDYFKRSHPVVSFVSIVAVVCYYYRLSGSFRSSRLLRWLVWVVFVLDNVCVALFVGFECRLDVLFLVPDVVLGFDWAVR